MTIDKVVLVESIKVECVRVKRKLKIKLINVINSDLIDLMHKVIWSDKVYVVDAHTSS